jgi:hypothetical protein
MPRFSKVGQTLETINTGSSIYVRRQFISIFNKKVEKYSTREHILQMRSFLRCILHCTRLFIADTILSGL